MATAAAIRAKKVRRVLVSIDRSPTIRHEILAVKEETRQEPAKFQGLNSAILAYSESDYKPKIKAGQMAYGLVSVLAYTPPNQAHNFKQYKLS
jgi:hypothetical protein